MTTTTTKQPVRILMLSPEEVAGKRGYMFEYALGYVLDLDNVEELWVTKNPAHFVIIEDETNECWVLT